MCLIEFFSKQPRSIIVSLGLLLVAILAIADYVTGPELFFLEFYLLPVLLVVWLAGEGAGVLISTASALSWFVDEVVGRSPHSQAVVPYVNVGVKFFIFLVFMHVVLALKGALERERFAERERIQREIDIARQVQERLFPQVLPPMKTLEYAGVCKPAHGVGGDYYDFIQLGRGRLGIALADISGKGISSALLMASLHATLRSRAFQHQEDLAELIRDVNLFMCANTLENKYATLFYGLYEDAAATLTYVNAGPKPPFLFRPSGKSHQVICLKGSEPVIGLLNKATYHDAALAFQPGDVLILYTDGVTEARNENEEEFGEERLTGIVAQNLSLSAEHLRDLILSHIQQFAGTAMQHDDLTLAVLKVR